MRVDKDGMVFTLEQDIKRIWEEHGWELIEEIVPAHPNNPMATWIIKAKVKESK